MNPNSETVVLWTVITVPFGDEGLRTLDDIDPRPSQSDWSTYVEA